MRLKKQTTETRTKAVAILLPGLEGSDLLSSRIHGLSPLGNRVVREFAVKGQGHNLSVTLCLCGLLFC